jgi:hypothetical protein
MQYKTIVLELLKDQHPIFHEQLRASRTLLTALDFYARGLKASHEVHKLMLSQTRPKSDPHQITSEAMELAIRDLQESLPSESLADEMEPLSLDAAIAFISRHTPPA